MADENPPLLELPADVAAEVRQLKAHAVKLIGRGRKLALGAGLAGLVSLLAPGAGAIFRSTEPLRGIDVPKSLGLPAWGGRA